MGTFRRTWPDSRRTRRLQRVALVALCALAAATAVPGPSVAAETVDGRYDAVGAIRAGGTLDLVVTGRGGVPPTGVGAVVLNVAATNVTDATFLTVWPTGTSRPTAANMNVSTGQMLSNMVIAKVGTGGSVSIYNYAGTVDVVVDVMGWFPTGGQYTALTPARLGDTRPGHPTADGRESGVGPLHGGTVMEVTVTGRGGVPPTGVGAVALNVAATNVSAASYLTVWPSGEARPTAANMNLAVGQTLSNMVVAKVGAGGKVSIYGLAGSTDVVVDVMGWFPSGGQYTGLTPARLADTRAGSPTIDGRGAGAGPVAGGSSIDVDVAGRGALPPSGVGAVVLNVAITDPTVGTFLTVWPTGQARPTAANMNAVAGQTLSNLVVAKVGAGGDVSIFNLAGTADVVVDVMGWFPSAGQYVGLSPARLADTRGSAAEPAGPPCSLPGSFVGGARLTAGTGVASLINGFAWSGATVEGVVALGRQVFTTLGPLAAAASDAAATWVRLLATDRVQGGQPLTKAAFIDSLTTAYHEAIHELQGFDCLPTGSASGFVIGAGWWAIGPPQSTVHADVRARVAVLVPNTASFCRSAAFGTADVYLSPSDPQMSGQGLNSQLWEINAYALEAELENVLNGSGVAVYRNTAVQSAKLHQLARYVNAMRATPGLWDTLRSVGVDDIIAAHWNFAVANWTAVGTPGARDCWTIAFGPDAAAIAEFTGGAAGTTAPPMP